MPLFTHARPNCKLRHRVNLNAHNIGQAVREPDLAVLVVTLLDGRSRPGPPHQASLSRAFLFIVVVVVVVSTRSTRVLRTCRKRFFLFVSLFFRLVRL